jgi:hypothetical protein
MGEHRHSGKHEEHHRLVARLRDQARDVERLVSGLDEARVAHRVIKDKWSLKELAAHLLRSQEIFEDRVARMLAEENPSVTPWDPDGDMEFPKLVALSSGDILARLRQGRERFTARLESLDPAGWHRPGRHPEYSNYDVHFQVEYMTLHEAHHLYQMYQRRAALGRIPHG